MREPTNATPEALLEAGIQALKAGWRQDAQNLIFKAIARRPTYVRAWLWMSEATTELEERIRCLEQVVSLDPEDEKVQARLQALREMQMQGWLQEAYGALENGERAEARALFLQVIDADEENLEAWWGLAHASESVDDQIICLENVLTLDPDHTEARERLSQIRPPGEAVKADGETERMEEPLDLEDELSCPFCGQPTAREDRVCPACNRRLWVKARKPSPIPLYWILNGLELGITLMAAMIPLLLIATLDTVFGDVNLRDLMTVIVSPSSATLGIRLTEVVPRGMTILSLVSVILSLGALLCGTSQWSPAYLIGSGFSALRALAELGLIVIALTAGYLDRSWETISGVTPPAGSEQVLTLTTWGVPVAGTLITGLSGLSIWAMMKLHNHFSVESQRRLLTIDRDVAQSEQGLCLRAREHAKRGAWALAALHARRALAYRRTAECYLLLATAYYHLDQADRARQALSEARDIQPDHPRIAALIEQLDKQ